MTIPDELVLEMIRGRTRRYDFVVTLAGVAQDISAWTLWMTAKRSKADPDSKAIFQLVTPSGGIAFTDAPNGKARATIAPADTVGLLDQADLYWDLKSKTGSGDLFTLAHGRLVVYPDVTRTS